jgi:hypothetical protein
MTSVVFSVNQKCAGRPLRRLTDACQVQVAALSCNVELQLPPDDVVAESYRLYLPTTRRPFGVLEWPALLRKLDKIDPSYRD